MNDLIADLFGRDKALLGMVHVRALPGTPRHALSMDEIVDTAAREARLLVETGFDGVLVENMHDAPYVMGVGPEIVAAMTAVAIAVRDSIDRPFGVQILAGSNDAAIAVAHASGGAFVRVENFVFASVADEGLWPHAAAGPLLRFRRAIDAPRVSIFADVKKKHASHALTADVDLAETVRAAEFFGADGVIVTGHATARPVAEDDLARAHDAARGPVLVGSGATPETVARLLRLADGVIVGSSIKRDGVWSNEIDPARARAIVDAAREA